MAFLQAQTPKLTGTVIAYAAAAVGGDTVSAGRDAVLHVRNGGGSSITVTVVTPGNTRYGQADPDIPVAIAAGAEAAIGPFPSELGDPVTGLASINYSAVTSVTVALIAA